LSRRLTGYYLPLEQGKLNANAWTERTDDYPAEPHGDSILVAGKLWKKYGQPKLKTPSGKPNAVSLTTGKPASCSSALPLYPASLANDGRSDDTDRYWATDVAQHPGAAWWQVDLRNPTSVARVVVVGYYGDERFYGFTVETSLDGKTWSMAADRRANKGLSTPKGYTCEFAPGKARYIRVTQTHNSANPGRHLVEVMAYEK